MDDDDQINGGRLLACHHPLVRPRFGAWHLRRWRTRQIRPPRDKPMPPRGLMAMLRAAQALFAVERRVPGLPSRRDTRLAFRTGSLRYRRARGNRVFRARWPRPTDRRGRAGNWRRLDPAAPGRARTELERALLDPGADILPSNRTVRLVTRDGEPITARVLNQDTFSLQLIDTKERVFSIPKSELREFAWIKSSSNAVLSRQAHA